MSSSKRSQTIRYHSEVSVFSGGGWSELLVYLPPFATLDELEEMREDLQKIGFATRKPFSYSSLFPENLEGEASGRAVAVKVHADDDQTLETLMAAKNTINRGVFPSE